MPMRPAEKHGNVWRKRGRAAERGVPTGRRSTHQMETAYGQQSRIRDNHAAWAAAVAAFEQARSGATV